MTTVFPCEINPGTPFLPCSKLGTNQRELHALQAIASSVVESLSKTLSPPEVPPTERQRSKRFMPTGVAKDQSPRRITEHISDSIVFGGPAEQALSAQAYYSISLRSVTDPTSTVRGTAHFIYSNNEALFRATVSGDYMTYELMGAERSGALSVCFTPLKTFEGNAVLFRVPLLQSTNLASGEFNIVVMSFSSAPESKTISHTEYVIEFRNRRWSLDDNLCSAVGMTLPNNSLHRQIVRAGEAV